MTATDVSEEYHDLIDCQDDEEFRNGAEDYNPIWYDYLKNNKASCLDHHHDFNF